MINNHKVVSSNTNVCLATLSKNTKTSINKQQTKTKRTRIKGKLYAGLTNKCRAHSGAMHTSKQTGIAALPQRIQSLLRVDHWLVMKYNCSLQVSSRSLLSFLKLAFAAQVVQWVMHIQCQYKLAVWCCPEASNASLKLCIIQNRPRVLPPTLPTVQLPLIG